MTSQEQSPPQGEAMASGGGALETALQRIARCLSRQYQVAVRYEGNEAKINPAESEIILPYVEEITEAREPLFNGLLDHKVAQLKHTNFPVQDAITGQFHDFWHGLVEDLRVDRALSQEFPGCEGNIQVIKDEVDAKVVAAWTKIPWPARLALASQKVLEGKMPTVDADFERQWKLVEPHLATLKAASTTQEVRDQTEALTRLIIKDREKEKQESQSKGKEGEGQPDPKKDGGAGDKLLASKKEGQGKGKGLKDLDGKDLIANIDQMGQAAFDEQLDELQSTYKRGFKEKPHIPLTTRFDEIHDFSGKLIYLTTYQHIKRTIIHQVRPIMTSLERSLRLMEDAKFKLELERGRINTKALARLVTDPDYRRPFKAFTKTEVNNVAVELVIDCSGSMSGSKLDLAKATACALGEALAGLDIPFEVVGFTSRATSESANFYGDYVSSMARDKVTLGKRDRDRFNRWQETLQHYVFKSFNCTSLVGIGGTVSCSNNTDGESVMWAANRLAQRGERRKILIVLSDGQPAGEGDSFILQSHLRSVVKGIIKSGIEVIAVGINTNAPTSYYPHSIQVNDLNTLAQTVMGEMTKLLLKGLEKY